MSATVSSGRSTYPAIFGYGVIESLPDFIASGKALIVATDSLSEQAIRISKVLGPACVGVLLLPDGESAKTLNSVENLWVQIKAHGLSSLDTLVAVGGGSLTDTVGFAAATWRRGMKWVVIPTTISAIVDASIGGKTGVNTLAGKNTAGVLWDPTAVISDLQLLTTLPKGAISDGLAEVVKVGLSHSPEILRELLLWDQSTLLGLTRPIELAMQVAVDVACGKFGEGNQADVLSLGHELAHSIKSVSGFQVSHGRAVSLGLLFSTNLSGPLTSPGMLELLRSTLKVSGLPTTIPELGVALPWDQIRQALHHDKRMGGKLSFLIPTSSGVRWSDVLSEEQVLNAWEALS